MFKLEKSEFVTVADFAQMWMKFRLKFAQQAPGKLAQQVTVRVS